MAAARLYFHLLGLFRLLQSDYPAVGLDRARVQDWLAYLVLHRASPISWQQFAFLSWTDSVRRQALRNLRTLLTRLRHALPDADHFISSPRQSRPSNGERIGETRLQVVNYRPALGDTLDNPKESNTHES
jgi:hypothetical protein